MTADSNLSALIEPLFAEQQDQLQLDTFCKYVYDKRPPFSRITESLGPSMLSSESDKRIRCFEVLRQLFSDIPSDYMLPDEIKHVTLFLSERLKSENEASIAAIFHCLHVMSQQFKASSEFAVTAFAGLSKNTYIQQFPVSHRFIVFQILGNLLAFNFDALKALEFDFISGFIQLIEGERDPRCLLLTFKLFLQVVQGCSLGHYDEDAFDVVSCYFPITYIQPSNDPYNISRHELASSLLSCLVALPIFAPFALPLFLEKATSDLSDSKKDAYAAIAAGAPVYGANSLSTYLGTIWASVRVETLKPNNNSNANELFKTAMGALASVTTAIESNEEQQNKFLDEVCYDLEAAIVKGELDLRGAAYDILVTCCSTKKSFAYVTRKMFPHLLERLASENDDRVDLLRGLEKFLQQLERFPESELSNSDAVIKTCLALSSSDDDEIRLAALNCSSCLIRAKLGSLSAEDRAEILVRARDALNLDSLRQAAIRLYKDLQSNPVSGDKDVAIDLLDVLNSSLPGTSVHVSTLKALACLTLNSELQRRLLRHLLKLLNDKSSNNSNKFDENFFQLFAKLVHQQSHDSDFIYKECLWPLLGDHLHSRICEASEWTETNDLANDKLVFAAVAAISRALSKEHATELVSLLSESYLLNKVEKLIPNFPPQCDCKPTLTVVNKRVVELLDQAAEAVFANVVPEAINEDAVKLIVKLIGVDTVNESLGRALCSFANKASDEFLTRISGSVIEAYDQNRDKKSLELIVWLTKGSVMRSHAVAKELINRLHDALRIEELSATAAKGFSTVHVHVPMSHHSENAFYHQKFFQESAATLLTVVGDRALTASKRQVYRSAVLGQLRYLPKAILKSEAKRLHTIAIAALEDDNESQAIAVKCVQHLLEENWGVLTHSLHSLVDNLLKLLKSGRASLDIRKESLVCLATISEKFPERSLLLERSAVVAGVKPLLDDKKRIVRFAASEARLKWLLVGEPGKEK